MNIIIDVNEDGFGDVMYKEESIGIVEVEDNVIRLRITVEDCINDERTWEEILQYREELPQIKQALNNLGYSLEKEEFCGEDIDKICIKDLKINYEEGIN